LNVYNAYLTASLTRAKKMPTIQTLLSGNKNVMKKIDEGAIIARLKEYQRRKNASSKVNSRSGNENKPV
jgi:hypothetical protein